MTALDVQELLRAQVCAEAGLGDGVVAHLSAMARRGLTELQPWAMLANGPPWMKRGRALERLHQVGLERVLEQRGHGALGLEVVGGDGLAVEGVGRR